jgi:CMP-N-acetylneuraminic acid synthetase
MFTIFLPCRSGSERVPEKNTKPFAEVEGGLLTIKLNIKF